MLNESFTQHMDAIKSCSTKQQCSVKVYLRDILHPYVNRRSGDFFLGGGGWGGGAGKKYLVLHIVFFSSAQKKKKKSPDCRLPLRFPGFSRFCLYFSSSFFNISSRCSNETLHVEGNFTRRESLLTCFLKLL